MDAISQTTFSNTFSWMKMFEFRLKFHWSLFLRFHLAIFQHWFRYWISAVQATSHYLNQWLLVYWRIYASLGLNELTLLMLEMEYSCFGGQYHPCLLMPWLLKSPGHQQACNWLCRTANMYCCSRVNFIYLCKAKSKIQFKMWIYVLQSLTH